MPQMFSIAVIVDPDEYLRLALRSLLTRFWNLPKILEADTIEEVLTRVKPTETIYFALITVPCGLGLDTCRAISSFRSTYPKARVAVMSQGENRQDILLSLEAGAHGFLPRRLGVSELKDAIETIITGSIYVPRSLAQASLDEDPSEILHLHSDLASARARLRPVSASAQLTKRQLEVLRMLVDGSSNKEIARSLNVSEGTVKVHVTGILRALGVRNRASAAVLASRVLAAE